MPETDDARAPWRDPSAHPGWQQHEHQQRQAWKHQAWRNQGWKHHDGPPPEWRMPRWFTLWVPVVVAFVIQVPSAIFVSRWFGDGARDTLLAAAIALIGPLALIAARRFPGPVVAVVTAAAALDIVISERGGPPYIALAFAIISAIVRGRRVWAWASLGAAWVTVITLSLTVAPRLEPGRIAATTLGILLVFGIGEGLRTRRERTREYWRRMGERRQSAVQQERVRIARELHDVLAHSLSQINVQAGVGLHLMDKQPDKAAEALASIKETSKTALDEVRSVLGMLRSEGGGDASAPLVPEPDLSRLADLVDQAGRGGLAVRLDDRLAHAGIPANVQLALYRIVQESLTNIARHAAGARTASVALDADDRAYRVEVRDDGTGSTAPAGESGGRGVLGMRERAELLGGHLTAGPAEGGGFRVLATIPIEGRP